MTEREYNAHPGIRRSALAKMAKSPAHYKWALDNPQPDTPSLLFGRALHAAVLQPEQFAKEYAIIPAVDRRTKEGRALYAKMLEDCKGKELLTQEEYDRVQGMAGAIRKHPFASALLDGEKEVSYFWTDADTGLECKSRTDAEVYLDKHYIVDLKSCTDASTQAFMRDAVKYGYDLQVGHYREGVKAVRGEDSGFIFIAIEKTPPYAINILQADDTMMLRGRDLFREYLGRVAECEKSGNWYSYNGFSGDINSLSLPGYIAKEYE